MSEAVNVEWLAKELGLDREGIDRRRELFGLGADDERGLAGVKPLVQAGAAKMADLVFQPSLVGALASVPEFVTASGASQ